MKDNGVGDMERDIMGYMPRNFVLLYGQLCEAAHVQLGSSLEGQGEGGTRQKYKTHGGGLRDEVALNKKRKIDRKLRQIVRDVDSDVADHRCVKCKGQQQAGWKYCANCGHRTGSPVTQSNTKGVTLR